MVRVCIIRWLLLPSNDKQMSVINILKVTIKYLFLTYSWCYGDTVHKSNEFPSIISNWLFIFKYTISNTKHIKCIFTISFLEDNHTCVLEISASVHFNNHLLNHNIIRAGHESILMYSIAVQLSYDFMLLDSLHSTS